MLTRQWERQAAMEENKIKMAESIAGQGPESDFLLDMLQRVDRQQLSELAGVPLSEVNQLLEQPPQTNVRKLDIEMPGGFTLRNISSDEDMNRAVHILRTLNLSVDSMAKLLAGPNPAPIVPVSQAPVQKTEEGGTTIQEMVPRYAIRKTKDRTSTASSSTTDRRSVRMPTRVIKLASTGRMRLPRARVFTTTATGRKTSTPNVL